jgi:hypothetical protein
LLLGRRFEGLRSVLAALLLLPPPLPWLLFSPWPLPLPRLDLSLSDLSVLSALSDLSSFRPRLVPPEIVVVAPLFLTLSPPSLGARDELELLRDTVAELLFDELRDRLRRL